MIAMAVVVTFVLTTILSMAGVGAAFVLIPVFLALGVELHAAMATALLLNAIAMSIASVTFIRKGLVEWRMVLPMLVIAVLASPLGVQVPAVSTLHVDSGRDVQRIHRLKGGRVLPSQIPCRLDDSWCGLDWHYT